jgi:phosphonate transport system substrate-binding protein
MSVDYRDLTNKIKNGEIDIAYLGPLPYALIRQHTNSVIPVVKFLDKKASSGYTCSVIAHKNFGVESIKDLNGKKISLPQKFSTCGYYSAKIAFDANGLKFDNYSFDGNHANVALSVLLGEKEGGSLQTTYFDKYAYLGLKKIYESEKLPGFLLAANKQKLSNEKIAQIKNAIVKLSPLTNNKDKQTTQNWGENIKYGAVDANEQEYATIVEKLKNMDVLR